ncbi:hypothetical protein E2C01_010608 [Portunus trituberculatus]|uniref:Uncharacterized protein n=1 Tax=Portunus trituberculatus TaxID=210409 RepID=A0A5B7D8X2_PORTR|nr:hypothetical protein [Portunus trituberculatus]
MGDVCIHVRVCVCVWAWAAGRLGDHHPPSSSSKFHAGLLHHPPSPPSPSSPQPEDLPACPEQPPSPPPIPFPSLSCLALSFPLVPTVPSPTQSVPKALDSSTTPSHS